MLWWNFQKQISFVPFGNKTYKRHLKVSMKIKTTPSDPRFMSELLIFIYSLHVFASLQTTHLRKTTLTLVLLRGVVQPPNGFRPGAQNRTAKG